jgi:hypothetical protein
MASRIPRLVKGQMWAGRIVTDDDIAAVEKIRAASGGGRELTRAEALLFLDGLEGRKVSRRPKEREPGTPAPKYTNPRHRFLYTRLVTLPGARKKARKTRDAADNPTLAVIEKIVVRLKEAGVPRHKWTSEIRDASRLSESTIRRGLRKLKL